MPLLLRANGLFQRIGSAAAHWSPPVLKVVWQAICHEEPDVRILMIGQEMCEYFKFGRKV